MHSSVLCLDFRVCQQLLSLLEEVNLNYGHSVEIEEPV